MQWYKLGFPTGVKTSWAIWAFVVLFLWFSVSSRVPAAEEAKPSVDRSRVYKLRYLTAEKAEAYLTQLHVGRRVSALSDKILIVTSDQPGDLVRTSSVLEILDSELPRSVRRWSRQADVGLPEISFLLSELKLAETYTGTLMDPPSSGVSEPIILDMHHEMLVGVGAETLLDRVDSIVQAWTSQQRRQRPASEAAEEPNVPQPAQVLAGPDAPVLMEELAEVMAAQPLVEAVPAAVPQMELVPAEEPAIPQPEVTSDEEFFTTELIQALTTAEENAHRLQEKIEAEKRHLEKETVKTPVEAKPAAEPQPTEEADPLLAILEALQRQSEPAEKEPPSDEKTIVTEALPEAPIETTPPEAPSDLARLEQQLARQEQQIAELKALLMDRAEAPRASVRVAPEMSEPEIPEGDKELELTITLPEKVEITSLLELVGKQLGLNYMYDPAQVRGDVTLKIHDGKIKVKDTYALLESVLRFRGFVMTRRGNLVTIVPASQMKQSDPIIRGPDEPIEPGDVIVSSIFHLDHVTPAAAQKMLTDMQLGTAFVPVAETNTLIVTDYAYRMDRVEKVITMVDVAGEPKEFKFRQLRYMDAANMTNKLKTLTAQMEGVTVAGTAAGAPATPAPTQVRRDARGRVIRTPAPAAAQQAAQAAAGPAQQETVFLDVDERTNRIMMIGYPDQISMINDLIDTLDVPKYQLRYVREYFIQNVEAADIVTAMNELGLASVTVSGGAQQAGRTAAAARQPAARPGQPAAAQPAAAAQAQTVTPAGEDQPYISIRPNTNSLLVNATTEQHEAIELVIAHVDVKQKGERAIQEYEIQNVDAMSVVKTLEDLGIIAPGQSDSTTARGGSTRQTSTRQPAAPQAQPGQPDAPAAMLTLEGEPVTELTAAQPQIAVLEATNSLLVNATPRQHAAISLVIAHVDRTLERVSTPYVVYPLENQDPDELAGVLNELIQETLEQAQKSAPDAKIQTGGATAATLPMKEEERIRIISDPMTYSLIVYANKKNQQWVGELIRELDAYRPQVLLDCTLVEITKDDQFKYEIDLVSKTYSTDGGSPPDSSVLRDTVGAALLNNSGFSLQRYAHGATSAGQITGFFNSEMVQGLLTAMQQNQYGRIMARPKILVNDNQEGEIKTEEIQAVAQIKTNVIPGTATQTSTTSQDATFTDYTAGVTLKIKPHISKGDMLRLEITLNRTDFGTTTKTIPISDGSGGTTPVPYPPDRTTTDITTVSTIPDGATIILGGLEKVKQNKLNAKVPILGDLPLVGGLFRDVNNRDEQGKLYVFVKANILRPGDQAGGLEDMRRVSGSNRQAFEEFEQNFQEMEDWPGIRPKTMEPRQILEEDNVYNLSEEETLY